MNTDTHQHAGITLSPIADFALNFVSLVWPGVVFVCCLLAAALVLAASRRIARRVADSFARANQTIADIQQPREENQP